ncbi:hypothetical protein EMPS_01069 [Entomortierella parvispora]|uniref:F-box domain-containing protein n=1 Tax=Entomortierella parvispora TaxID=205924 RepID=A0A9P3LS81_9FUNG|nr:hypothetical protein EMPS_01069 [Entomortierella parvispora]
MSSADNRTPRMDILSRVPPEIALQILAKLDISDVATCQLVSRQWYWITVDQSVWKNIFLEHERPFAIPTTDFLPIMVPTFVPTPSMDIDEEGDDTFESTNTSVTMVATERDWKQECKTRVISDRNWAKGQIQSLMTLSVHRGGIARLRIKPGMLLSGDMFGCVAIWDTTTYACLDLIEASNGPIMLLDFSPAAMVMTVISRTSICRIWDLRKKTIIHSCTASDVVCMTMDDNYLVFGERDCEIRIVNFMTGELLRSAASLGNETLKDIYIQNNTLVVATSNSIRVVSLDSMEILMTCKLPVPETLRTYCSVFHIRSLILLADNHLLHLEWEPLRKSPHKRLDVDTRFELPPNLNKAPYIHKTKVPPISTITSIAIGGKHPHVLTTNADRPSLNDTIRVCPTAYRRDRYLEQERERLIQDRLPQSSGGPQQEAATTEAISLDEACEDTGIVLTSPVDGVSHYLEGCGLKPSFMDVDEDVIVIGTSKGDIVVLHMLSQE